VNETAPDVADEALAKVPEGGAVVLFDGVCNFCSWSVRFIHEHDDGTLRFAPLQSEVGTALLERHGLEADYFDSLVYLGSDGVHTKSDGAVRITRHLEGPWGTLWLSRFVPTPVRDVAYGLFGSFRYRLFGKKESCMIPGPDLRERFLDEPTDEFGTVQTA
jgi:predicted DCC family thiol-disulfide oxidoreductase YuxK